MRSAHDIEYEQLKADFPGWEWARGLALISVRRAGETGWYSDPSPAVIRTRLEQEQARERESAASRGWVSR